MLWCSSGDSNPVTAAAPRSYLSAPRCFAQKTLRVLVSGVRALYENEKDTDKPLACPYLFGAPAGIRTPDTLLKRQVLCLLSYWGGWLGWRDSNPLYRSQSPVCYHYTTSQCLCERDPRPRGRRPLSSGVGYGARTHDTRNHNPVLYQLS